MLKKKNYNTLSNNVYLNDLIMFFKKSHVDPALVPLLVLFREMLFGTVWWLKY